MQVYNKIAGVVKESEDRDDNRIWEKLVEEVPLEKRTLTIQDFLERRPADYEGYRRTNRK